MNADYDTSFRCAYRGTTDDQQDDAYRSDVLRAFKLKKWDEAAVGRTLDRLFEHLRGIPGVGSLLARLRARYPAAVLLSGDDDRTIFQLLFSFDLFDKAHATICNLLERGEMSDAGLASLSENL
jgi:hypothetical protein